MVDTIILIDGHLLELQGVELLVLHVPFLLLFGRDLFVFNAMQW